METKDSMPLHNIQAVLFDLDGTLLDTHDLLLETFHHTVRTVLKRTIPDEVLMAKVGQPLDTQMWDFTDDQAEHDELCRVYREYNAVIHDDWIKVFPGIALLLDELSDAGVPLGVVTSKRHAAALRGLSRFNLEGSFKFVVGSDDWPTHKPDPGPVAHGCDLLGIAPQQCLYVGDSPFDMQAGNGAGCPTAAALWGMFSRPTLEAQNPTYVCSTPADIIPLVIG
ncbi:HAD family hydrolase [Eggerthella sp. YY7918]|uniref:HAD family hydrolase n=1 Tax=Eggerthella sp. (strain YY7918) TaxID=502558 RepID=UPI0002F225D4|nr:HAD-IA family hydrolase [Eggerthella sp. YY7918]